jgi:hypothetical protein
MTSTAKAPKWVVQECDNLDEANDNNSSDEDYNGDDRSLYQHRCYYNVFYSGERVAQMKHLEGELTIFFFGRLW